MVRLYLEELAIGDFEPVFRAMVGDTAALSPTSIVRLNVEWQQEYETWKKRPLRGRYVYHFADGLYLKAGGERDKTSVLVVLGVDNRGQKGLMAMEEGYRESTAAWAETLRLSLNWRGINPPNQLRLLLAGHRFEDGKLILEDARAPTRWSRRRCLIRNYFRERIASH